MAANREGQRSRRRAHVIGAGISGLAAATQLAAKGMAVSVYETAGQAGGRCRSYYDPALDQVIDNGNHLVLTGNGGVGRYLERIGARGVLAGPRRAVFPFADLKTDLRWVLRLNGGPLPWWITAPGRRVPGTSPGDYAAYAKLMFANRKATIAQVVPTEGAVWDRLMRPFFLAALNTEPETASAQLAGQVMRETLARGGRACRPRIATPHLASAFVDPALRFLKEKGATVEFGRRLRTLVLGNGRVLALEFPETTVPLDRKMWWSWRCRPGWRRNWCPNLAVPTEFRAIVNAHFRCSAPKGSPADPGRDRRHGGMDFQPSTTASR